MLEVPLDFAQSRNAKRETVLQSIQARDLDCPMQAASHCKELLVAGILCQQDTLSTVPHTAEPR